MDSKTIKAIKCEQNNKTFYLTTISSKILEKVCFISRREDDIVNGFQRALSEPRAKSIANYMDNEKGCLPSTLILSAQKISKIVYDEKKYELSFEIKNNSFMVLDGQHRLYGLFFSENDYDMPVVIFENLKIEDEVNLFIDINTNQKGVPTALLLDIKELTGKETTLEEKQRELFKKLDENSPLSGSLSPNQSKTGFIARNVFNMATKELLENGYFSDKDVDIVYKGVKNYLEAAEYVLLSSKHPKAKLTTANMFKALFSLFNDIVDKAFSSYGDLKVEHLQEILMPIAKTNFDKIGTNNADLRNLLNDMKSLLNGYSTKYRNVDEDSIF